MRDLIQRLAASDEVMAVLIAAGLSVLIAVIGRLFSPRGRIAWAVWHQHVFLTHHPQQGPLLVHTRYIWVQNIGRASVEDVEVIFNFPPHHFEIWPQRQYESATNPGNNLIVKFRNLSAREYFAIALLNVAADLPRVTNV